MLCNIWLIDAWYGPIKEWLLLGHTNTFLPLVEEENVRHTVVPLSRDPSDQQFYLLSDHQNVVLDLLLYHKSTPHDVLYVFIEGDYCIRN